MGDAPKPSDASPVLEMPWVRISKHIQQIHDTSTSASIMSACGWTSGLPRSNTASTTVGLHKNGA